MKTHARFKALTAVLLKIQIFGNVRLCRWVEDLGHLTPRIEEILSCHISETNTTVLHPTKVWFHAQLLSFVQGFDKIKALLLCQ
jgi:hypothetical protein